MTNVITLYSTQENALEISFQVFSELRKSFVSLFYYTTALLFLWGIFISAVPI